MNHFLKTVTIAFFVICLLSAVNSPGQSAVKPYNENQNARADLNTAIAKAQKENKHVLIQFGGNWCSWCMRFHALVSGDPKIDSLMTDHYIYLLLNVPHEKEKRDNTIFEEFQYPNRFGYPVFVILDKNGKRLNTQDSDALEYQSPVVKGYDTAKVIRFLSLWTPKALDPASYQKK